MPLLTASTDDPTADVVDEFSGLQWSDWIAAGVIFAVAIFLAVVAKSVLVRLLRRNQRVDPALAELIARVAGYVIVVVGFVYALESLGVDIALVLGALGVVGIALAFALQDILENFVAGVLLQIQRPFTYGEQVMINDHEGTVQGIDSRLVTILTPAGELVKIPSSTVIKSDIVNYTKRGRRRSDLAVGVAYGTDLAAAQALVLAAVGEVDGVLSTPEPEVWFEGFGESSIDFAVRFWHTPTIAEQWRVRSDVGLAVERALAGAGITIPFPQRTMWWAGETEA